MARNVSVLVDHPKRLELDRALLDGQLTVTEIAARFEVSRAAVHRYRSAHLAPLFREQLRATELGDAGSIIERLIAVADDSRRMRVSLLEEGKASAHASAARAETQALEALLDRLGIDSTDIAETVREGRVVGNALRDLIRHDPRIGTWLARRFSTAGEHALERAVLGLIETKEVKS